MADTVAEFDPDQPRDDHGRFTPGSGGGDSSSGGTGGGTATLEQEQVTAPIGMEGARGDSRAVSAEEFQKLAGEGKDRLAEIQQQPWNTKGLTGSNWEGVKDRTWGEVQKSWGGATIDPRTGKALPQGVNKYAMSIKPSGMDTTSIHEGSTRKVYDDAMDAAAAKYNNQLAKGGSYLGVFHDDELHRIDIDPVTVLGSHREVETIGAYTHAIGGAYNFKDGNGYWPPHVEASASAAADDQEEAETVHWEGPGQWHSHAVAVQAPFDPPGDAEPAEAGRADASARPVTAATDTVEVPEFATWPDIELVAVGEWPLSTGPANFTSTDLAQAAAATRCPSVGNPVLKLGHHDPRFDGEPAIGWVQGMHLNDTQTKLLGDFTGMPGWLAEIMPSAYPNRSIEGMFDFVCQQGHTHPFVITAVALLGVTPPGVGTIGSLNDIAELYGIDAPEPADTEAARPFTLTIRGGAMPAAQRAGSPEAAGVVPTVDDIRRTYYEEADWSQWIVEVQVTADGPVLIVIDDSTGQLIRVPVNVPSEAGGTVTFGDPSPVLVSYVDAPDDSGKKAAAALASVSAFPPGRELMAAWASRRESRRGLALAGALAKHNTDTGDGTWDGPANETNLPTEEGTADDYRQAYAWVDPDGDPDTKAAYKFIHHFVGNDGDVGNASTVACSAGIAVLNGGRGGSNIPDSDVQGVYNHLAGHLTDADLEPPELNASGDGEPASSEGAPAEATTRHGAFDGEHEHPHNHGGETHFHMHTHNGSGRHDHAHSVTEAPPAEAAASTTKGAADMQFSDEQLAAMAAKLNKKVEELTGDDIAAAIGAGPVVAVIDAAADGGADLPPITDGAYLVDGSILRDYQERAARGDAAVRELHVNERDGILAAAVREGKFPQSRLEHYQLMWDKDPDGARAHVAALASGLVPMVGPVGGNPGWDPDLPGDFDSQAAYRQLYPDDGPRDRAGRR